ncbi:alpha/beta hydrolase [Leptolyngbya sp. BC1307]|uniref:alpha/beta hydrolase n=1 Tax=Leptolyngbya sp. BC1307 TaxID=2029589 RepID=UPI000EFB6475|nr:alpha/beta hydrolase [Leptolyngbya sp. BC1307]
MRKLTHPLTILGLSRFRVRTAALLSGLCLSGLLPLTMVKSAAAAERVTLTYGFLEISTSVEALRAYGENGTVDAELAPYLRLLSEDQRSQFRQALQVRQNNIGPAQLSQFLYSSIGQNILRYAGGVVRTAGRRDGAKGLRGALVLAAAEPEGLSLLGVIENFPTRTVRIDSLRGFQILGSLTNLVEETTRAIAAIENQSDQSAFPPTSPLPDLTQPGPFQVSVQTLEIYDSERDRTLPTDLYLPARPDSSPAPLIVISHGLSGDRTGFVNVAQHLASYGFAVAALDHPGSDRRQLEDLLSGAAREIAKPTEFADRPRDVSYLIDELTQLSAANGPLANRLETSRVGVIGHSFGGYTALALAGAQLNFETLQTNCDSEDFIFNAANPSMLLQCTALAAPEQFAADLRDPRVQAVMAMNPVDSSLFGQAGFSKIDIPILLVAGSADPVAPALLEQIRPFTWLNQSEATAPTPDQYLALIEGGSHLYDVPSLAENADSPLTNQLVSSNIPLSYSYLRALSLGFMQTEIAQNLSYRGALSEPYISRLSQPDLPLYVVNSLSEAALTAPPADSPEDTGEETAPQPSAPIEQP